ncbi:molybdenum cofactor biosynthesis protein MoaE [Pedobacter sp. MW01-1-1]|uniref:molybdenum cofactor biosynthesis protein MoaE n=1 Tax=Pedobacter sp. MW01-1-1 TaxID=3383027 RepID=UPI003FEF4258
MNTSASSHPAVEAKKLITAEAIDVNRLLDELHDEQAGAVVLFSGTVRNRSLGKAVAYLFYEAAEEMAAEMLQALLNECHDKWPLVRAFAVHRVGEVRVGECAVAVITASMHRKEAYEANRFLIEKIKHELPVWKCEYFVDGTKEWGGNCSCQQVTGDANVHIYES